MKTLYFFGDSIVFGQGISPHQIWTTLVAEKLSSSHSDLIVQCHGVNGDTTRGALDRVEYFVASHSPDYVWLQFGINDSNCWSSERGLPRVSSDSYVANTVELITRLLTSGTEQIFLATNHDLSLGTGTSERGKLIANLELNNHRLRSLPSNFSPGEVVLADVERHFRELDISPNDYLLADGVHLSEIGHKEYANFAMSIVSDALAPRVP